MAKTKTYFDGSVTVLLDCASLQPGMTVLLPIGAPDRSSHTIEKIERDMYSARLTFSNGKPTRTIGALTSPEVVIVTASTEVIPDTRPMTREEIIDLLRQMVEDPKSYYNRRGTYARGQRTVLKRILNMIQIEDWSTDLDGSLVLTLADLEDM